MSTDESFDVGVDTRAGVDSSYKLPVRFTGEIDKLTCNLGLTQVSGDDQKIIRTWRASDGAWQPLRCDDLKPEGHDVRHVRERRRSALC